MTATASLAFPSAVSPSTRTQSHLSQDSASFGRTWPHNGHSIVSAETGGSKVGASVYSTVPPGLRSVRRLTVQRGKISSRPALCVVFSEGRASARPELNLGRAEAHPSDHN